MILVFALGCSVYIHHLSRKGKLSQSTDVDKVVRTAIPIIIYPSMVLSSVVCGLAQKVWPGIITFVCLVGFGVFVNVRAVLLERRAKSA